MNFVRVNCRDGFSEKGIFVIVFLFFGRFGLKRRVDKKYKNAKGKFVEFCLSLHLS